MSLFRRVEPKLFAEVYNDPALYPKLVDITAKLGLSERSIRRHAAEYRAQELEPALIIRHNHGATAATLAEADETLSPGEHAMVRAESLAEEITDLVTDTRYPLINPEAIRVESYLTRKYDRDLCDYVLKEGTPRTWLTDTLRAGKIEDPRNRVFIFTGAQNDAEVDQDFWQNLTAYAKHRGAEIVVGPWTYETQWWSENNPTSRSYDSVIREHLCYGQLELGDNFVFCGEMNTLPTASRPISNLVTYSRGRWAVFPHSKIQLKSVPSTDPTVQAHQVMTSGACTRPKVIPRKAGVTSIFHHVIGATIVEFDSQGRLFCRQINADDDGSFQDLDCAVHEGVVVTGCRVRAVVVADLHRRKLNARNAGGVFGRHFFGGTPVAGGSMLETLNPEWVLFHDIFDNETRNHHHLGDNAYSYEMAYRGRTSVFEEVREAAEFLDDLSSTGARLVVVDSNHDLGLERYVREGRYRNDGINVRYGLKLEDRYLQFREDVADCLDKGERPPTFSLLEHAMREVPGLDLTHVNWVHDGQSFLIDDIECGHHGFRGANGAKGTVTGFARMGRKISFGDKHSPEIMDGAYGAGVMELQHGYNKGPSGWATTHIVHYPNGKRSLVTQQEGAWRAFG